eukprot:TRINITY_DN10975_c0_g1_i1.p1 TRINITY_DN10975_c0_g1~~TRINITY_DN10975_c0_g1_i1.p1  ORF type:complete len:191 (-),score=45.06 TRINITY_DN10975_c0_g1_i1:25-597(-)
MSPIHGVIQLRGDITQTSTANQIISHFDGQKADLVVCDGAPDVTGTHDIDEFVQAQLLLAAFNITSHVLKEGGTFVAKFFRGKEIDLLYSQMKIFFPEVTVVKPLSSRGASIESFIVCQNYTPPAGYQPTMIDPFKTNFDVKGEGINEVLLPFLMCGDLSGSEKFMKNNLGVNIQIDEERANQLLFGEFE